MNLKQTNNMKQPNFKTYSFLADKMVSKLNSLRKKFNFIIYDTYLDEESGETQVLILITNN